MRCECGTCASCEINRLNAALSLAIQLGDKLAHSVEMHAPNEASLDEWDKARIEALKGGRR